MGAQPAGNAVRFRQGFGKSLERRPGAPNQAIERPAAEKSRRKVAAESRPVGHAEYLASLWEWASKTAQFSGYSHDLGPGSRTQQTPENTGLSGVKLVAGAGFEPATFRL